jgi:hypothetical protein
MNSDQHNDRMFWLLLIGLAIGIVLLVWRFPRTSSAVIAALGITGALYRLGLV